MCHTCEDTVVFGACSPDTLTLCARGRISASTPTTPPPRETTVVEGRILGHTPMGFTRVRHLTAAGDGRWFGSPWAAILLCYCWQYYRHRRHCRGVRWFRDKYVVVVVVVVIISYRRRITPFLKGFSTPRKKSMLSDIRTWKRKRKKGLTNILCVLLTIKNLAQTF